MQMLDRDVVLSTVSGAASTKPALIRFFDDNVPAVSIITTKSFQVRPNAGNREPVITEPQLGCFGNSVGLRNPGMDQALSEIKALREGHPLRCLLNISVSASSIDDFVTLVRAFSPYADLIELNFSCPHAASGYGSAIGGSAEIASSYVAGIRKGCPDLKCRLLAKLTPNVEDIASIAKAVIDAGADGITAINTAGPEVYQLDGFKVLNNALGGKGGQSGRWIFEKACAAVKAIRCAIGKGPMIIGEGGVSSGADAARLIQCGADAIGIGSALAMVRQQDWSSYLEAVRTEARSIVQGKGALPAASLGFLDTANRMEYVKHKVLKVIHHDESTVVITLDGKLDSNAGEFAFIWIPGSGEKPFSVATSNPLRFIIKKRGLFTERCMKLEEGDSVYVRGLYGKPAELVPRPEAILVAGGTGEAVLPELARALDNAGTSMRTYVGVTSCNGGIMEDELSAFGPYTAISDDGMPGRVIDEIPVPEPERTAVYIVGPERFMAKAAMRFSSLGVSDDAIMISMEKNSMCGIGLCGECEMAGRLACQHGTFQSYAFLHSEGLL